MPDKPRVTLLGPTWVSAVNIDEITIFSVLGIKPGTNLLGLNDKYEVVLWTLGKSINKRWIFYGIKWFMDRYYLNVERNMIIPEKFFSGFSVMTVADLLQLPLVRGKLIFSQFFDKDSINHLLGLQLWHIFEYAELTEAVRKNEKLVINLLNKVGIGNIDDNV